jgi:hypothetical protein
MGQGFMGGAGLVRIGFGMAAAGDLGAEGAGVAGVAGDLAADVARALVVARTEVNMAPAGIGQQRVADLQLGVPGGHQGCDPRRGGGPAAGGGAPSRVWVLLTAAAVWPVIAARYRLPSGI